MEKRWLRYCLDNATFSGLVSLVVVMHLPPCAPSIIPFERPLIGKGRKEIKYFCGKEGGKERERREGNTNHPVDMRSTYG